MSHKGLQSYLFGDVGDFLLQALDLHVEVPAAWSLGDGDDVDRTQKHKHTHESWPLPLHGTGGKTIICVTLSSAVCCPTTHCNILKKSITAGPSGGFHSPTLRQDADGLKCLQRLSSAGLQLKLNSSCRMKKILSLASFQEFLVKLPTFTLPVVCPAAGEGSSYPRKREIN